MAEIKFIGHSSGEITHSVRFSMFGADPSEDDWSYLERERIEASKLAFRTARAAERLAKDHLLGLISDSTRRELDTKEQARPNLADIDSVMEARRRLGPRRR